MNPADSAGSSPTPEGFDRSLDDQAFLPEGQANPSAVPPQAQTAPPVSSTPLPPPPSPAAPTPPADAGAQPGPTASAGAATANQMADQAKELLKGFTWDAVSIAIVAGGAAMFLGAFMTWAKVAGWVSVSGLDGDGKLTLVLGLGAVAAGVYGLQRNDKRAVIGSLVCAALAFLIAGNSFLNVNDAGGDFFGDGVSVGFGLWLTLLGAIAGIAGPAIYLTKGRI